jgi:hypothetical protein
MSRRAPSWLALTPGEVYTLHFWPPYGDPDVQLAKHYTGTSEEGRLTRRLTDHALGRGARLTQVQREAGGTWVVADVQPGTRDREQQLKERGAARRCSVCKASRDIESGKLTNEQALAQWENATEYERSLLREIFGMEPEADKPAPVPVREMTPAPQPEPLTITPEMEALVDALIESWTTPKTEPALHREMEAGA